MPCNINISHVSSDKPQKWRKKHEANEERCVFSQKGNILIHGFLNLFAKNFRYIS
jgi:hypothetical protein